MARPSYSFYICPDPQMLSTTIAKALDASGVSGWERKAFWGDDDDPLPQVFWQDLTIKGLFSQPKALVVRRAHKLKAEQWKKLNKALRTLGSDVWPFFCLEGQWKGKKPPVPAHVGRLDIYKHARSSGWVWEYPGLDEKDLRNFVSDWAARNNLTLDRGVLQALASALPTDAVASRLELQKLELAVEPGGTVTRQHAELVAPSGEMEFFELMDALGKQGVEAAVWKRVLEDHLKKSSDRMIFNLIGYLASQARMYWMLMSGEESKVKAHPYVKKIKTPVARRLGRAGVARMIDLALDAELSIKTGTRNPEEVLDFLVAGLISLFRQPGRA
ncbi:DNA polymerase III subunit delta [Pseudodesulfovibrio senegalensis]|uniref:DNA polymerase III subunit delta n=1 Tax=Pseudodesulfovibrio senegalensis TaxID=1721087 RepID=A0A6N6N4J9_9BACT|nr:DNA polymerase III subunit delta [Pseudodesulfovibrio senegalensis]KAB1442994.1 DNA polymerase III subunit delta [Pseudodesulfovibrio senegalensis]